MPGPSVITDGWPGGMGEIRWGEGWGEALMGIFPYWIQDIGYPFFYVYVNIYIHIYIIYMYVYM